MKKRQIILACMASMMMACGGTDLGEGGKGFVSDADIVAPEVNGQALSDREIELSWPNLEGENQIEVRLVIQREEDGGFSDIASLDPDSTQYMDSGLQQNTSYSYRIRVDAVDAPDLDSGISSVVTVTTLENEGEETAPIPVQEGK